MNKFKKLNNIVGWAVFLIATTVYLLTMERTASLWDCGEFIAAAYKLEVVHAPGAPFFLLLGRIFSLFAADASQVAMMINGLSVLASSFTILFLFWTITAFGRKIYLSGKETSELGFEMEGKNVKKSNILAVLGAGVVGSLAYTFSDSFWFSAVEGEVYALSSFFTAITFWCILKWEQSYETKNASKWLVLIAYLIGLSIGVHLLSLLTIPAMGMIYHFKRNQGRFSRGEKIMPEPLGSIIAFLSSSLILVFIQGVLIPKTASLMGWFDKTLVNEYNLPFYSGVTLFLVLTFGLIIFGLVYTRKAWKNPTLNTMILCILFLLIGYSSYATVLVRSNTNTPINIGSPDDPLKLSSYLQRDQYGDWPIVRGEQYNEKYPFVSPIDVITEGDIFERDTMFSSFKENTDREIILCDSLLKSIISKHFNKSTNNKSESLTFESILDAKVKARGENKKKKFSEYYENEIVQSQLNNDPKLIAKLEAAINGEKKNKEQAFYFTNLMFKDLKNGYQKVGTDQSYVYDSTSFFPRMWSDQKVSGYERWRESNGNKTNSKISFKENLHFFFDYQIGWSYMRYFMWNFAGRQNDIQSMDQNDIYGNWESGLSYAFSAEKEEMPSHLKDNKGKNHYFFFPLILGMLGIFFHFKYSSKDAISVLLFFLFTGILIIVYLNVPPDQPRERDYAYVGSFYAFAIWIGIGVLGMFDLIKKGSAILVVQTNVIKQKINDRSAAILAIIICLLAVPVIMASENWDDHDRSGRSIAIDLAKNYLDHLEPNAIIFTNGDNDTYPLWYAQEVERVQLDARVVNMSLLGMDWYIEQVKRKVYDADPVPSTLTHSYFKGNSKNGIPVYKNKNTKDASQAIKEINEKNKCPKHIIIKVDTNNIPKSDLEKWRDKDIVSEIKLTVKGDLINQYDIALLDILANFDFSRPLYFVGATGAEQTLGKFSRIGKDANVKTQEDVKKYFGLLNYIQDEGAVARLVPFELDYANQTNIDIDKSYDNLMNNYNYGNIPAGIHYQLDSDIYFDYYTDRSIYGFRSPFLKTATNLLPSKEMKRNDSIQASEFEAKAINLTNKYFETFPVSTGMLDVTSIGMAEIYEKTKHEAGYDVIDFLFTEYELQKNYLKKKKDDSGFYFSNDGEVLFSNTKSRYKNIKNIKNRISSKENIEDAYTTESGLSYKIVEEGEGDVSPNELSTVMVHYTGKLEDGTVFDSSVDRGEPATFGLNQVIAGWTEILQLMTEGDKWEVTIPSELGYGQNGVPSAGIGANATLIFEIELIEIL